MTFHKVGAIFLRFHASAFAAADASKTLDRAGFMLLGEREGAILELICQGR